MQGSPFLIFPQGTLYKGSCIAGIGPQRVRDRLRALAPCDARPNKPNASPWAFWFLCRAITKNKNAGLDVSTAVQFR